MHVEQSNNITVAYATPLNIVPDRTSIIPQHRAIVTRGDLLSTSKYYKYHKTMGHTPQHIQHVAGSQRKRLLAESGLPTHMHKQVYLIHDTSVKKAKNANKQQHSDITPPSMATHLFQWTLITLSELGALPVKGELLLSGQQSGYIGTTNSIACTYIPTFHVYDKHDASIIIMTLSALCVRASSCGATNSVPSLWRRALMERPRELYTHNSADCTCVHTFSRLQDVAR